MLIEYEKIFSKIHRKTVAMALEKLAKNNKAKIYLTFYINKPGIVIPQFFKEKYTEKSVILLDNDSCCNLKVENQVIYVDLTFNKIMSTLIIPIKHVIKYEDKLQNIELNFIEDEEDENVNNAQYDQKDLIINFQDILKKNNK